MLLIIFDARESGGTKPMTRRAESSLKKNVAWCLVSQTALVEPCERK